MKRKQGALSAETREKVLAAIAQKAAEGSIAAAKLYLDEYRAQNGTPAEANPLLLSLYELERKNRA